MSKPLEGVRVIELAGIGPGPHACMMLADLGAEVVRVVRRGAAEAPSPYTRRGRTTVEADLKDAADQAVVHDLIACADVLIEGYRPGVMERLGLVPEELMRRNPRLVVGRMTGWGQTGPLAPTAGHDINYISLTGALHAIGAAEGPIPPLNLVGDYGGGSMLLVNGVLAALVQRSVTGVGQVVDAAMVDGAALLLAGILELRPLGMWSDEPASNILDGAAPYYRTYRCADGRFMAAGAVEPQFYALLVRGLGLDAEELPDRDVKANWPTLCSRFAAVFAAHPREHWEKVFAGTDACVTPVLSFSEAARHPHVTARRALRADGDEVIPGAAPQMSAGSTEPAPVGVQGDLHAVREAWMPSSSR